MQKLSIKIGDLEFFAELSNDNKGTVETVLANLPIRGKARRWGEEIYFFVPFGVALEHGKEECGPGEIGFWPEGPAIAIFFGKTPVSTSDKPRAYSPCNFFAKLVEPLDKAALNSVADGAEILIDLAK